MVCHIRGFQRGIKKNVEARYAQTSDIGLNCEFASGVSSTLFLKHPIIAGSLLTTSWCKQQADK